MAAQVFQLIPGELANRKFPPLRSKEKALRLVDEEAQVAAAAAAQAASAMATLQVSTPRAADMPVTPRDPAVTPRMEPRGSMVALLSTPNPNASTTTLPLSATEMSDCGNPGCALIESVGHPFGLCSG